MSVQVQQPVSSQSLIPRRKRKRTSPSKNNETALLRLRKKKRSSCTKSTTRFIRFPVSWFTGQIGPFLYMKEPLSAEMAGLTACTPPKGHEQLEKVPRDFFLPRDKRVLLQKICSFWTTDQLKKFEFGRKVFIHDSNLSRRDINKFFTVFIQSIPYLDKRSGELIHESYNTLRHKQTKHHLDPFARAPNFLGFVDPHDGKTVRITTVAQLNFFKWFFEHDLAPILTNLKEDVKKQLAANKTQHKRPPQTLIQNNWTLVI